MGWTKSKTESKSAVVVVVDSKRGIPLQQDDDEESFFDATQNSVNRDIQHQLSNFIYTT